MPKDIQYLRDPSSLTWSDSALRVVGSPGVRCGCCVLLRACAHCDCLLSAREREDRLLSGTQQAVHFERQADRKAGTVTSQSVGGVRSHCVSPSVDVPAKATRDESLQWPCHETSGKLPMTWQREPYARARRLDGSKYGMLRSNLEGGNGFGTEGPASLGLLLSACAALGSLNSCGVVVPPWCKFGRHLDGIPRAPRESAMISDTQASYIRRQDARWSHEGSRSHSSNGLPWDRRARRRRQTWGNGKQ